MKKNYTKYGTTGILWALYLIVGAVAFLVSDFYFKFALKDAIIFGAVNLVVVVLITEGIDLIFKKVKLHQERKNAEKESAEELPSEEATPVVTAQTDKASEQKETPVSTDGEVSPKENLDTDTNPVATPVADAPPILITGDPGPGKNGARLSARLAALKKAETTDSNNTEAVADEAPMLITGRPGLGHGYWSGAHLDALKEAEPTDSGTKEASVDTDVAETPVESPVSEDSLTQSTVAEPAKPRGRRANPEAIIDAPTSSIPVITPDMIKPRVETVADPVAEPVVEEPVAKETYLSADEFLSTTKLTSPRAIVREYQRLGGKDDIFNILMERQK